MVPSALTTEVGAGTTVWPDSPYKGLNYYSTEDAALFTGRDKDVQKCATLLAQRTTRVLLLHGRTGCGKSSFLRAGLIPFLEDPLRGFEFLKGLERGKVVTLFVRSTAAPLKQLAEAVFDYVSSEQTIETPLGTQLLPLRQTLPVQFQGERAAFVAGDVVLALKNLGFVQFQGERAAFVAHVHEKPEALVEVLGRIAASHPRTLVLILDQAEEVFTLAGRVEGSRSEMALFEFVARLTRSDIDLKLLVTLRTDFFGQFDDGLRRQTSLGVKKAAIEGYLLRDLETSALLDAICLPTSRKPFKHYGVPYERYRFEFEEGLPERIVADVTTPMIPAGGVLPVVQLVCERLYRDTKESRKGRGEPFTIGREDYLRQQDHLRLGGIHGQVNRYIDEVLSCWFTQQGLSKSGVEEEVTKWKYVLWSLVQIKPDGTTITDVKTTEELEVNAFRSGCIHYLIHPTIQHLEKDEQRVLRPTELQNREGGESVPAYSLGHDALAQALKKWREVKEETDKVEERAFSRAHVLGILYILLSIFYGPLLWWKGDSEHSMVAEVIACGFSLFFGVWVLVFPRGIASRVLMPMDLFLKRIAPSDHSKNADQPPTSTRK